MLTPLRGMGDLRVGGDRTPLVLGHLSGGGGGNRVKAMFAFCVKSVKIFTSSCVERVRVGKGMAENPSETIWDTLVM